MLIRRSGSRKPTETAPLRSLRRRPRPSGTTDIRSEEHTSELQSPYDLVCRLLLVSRPPPTSTLFPTRALPISLFGSEVAAQAKEDIAALQDETAKSVKGTINAHKTVWEQKTDGDRATAIAQAQTASLRHYGHQIGRAHV